MAGRILAVSQLGPLLGDAVQAQGMTGGLRGG